VALAIGIATDTGQLIAYILLDFPKESLYAQGQRTIVVDQKVPEKLAHPITVAVSILFWCEWSLEVSYPINLVKADSLC
jgi:hypothetical protein